MLFERRVLGLDIGSYAVKAVELEASLRHAAFRRFEALILPRGAPPEEVEATVHFFVQQRSLAAETLVTCLPSDQLTQRHLRFPFAGARKVAAAIDFELEEELPVPLDEVVRTHEQVLAKPDQTDVLVVMARREAVEFHLDAMRRMELDPRVVEAEGAVLANLSHHLNESDLGRLYLDVGHSKTNVCLIVDGKPVLLRRIPVAGRDFTETLAGERGLSFEDAEAHKHERGLFEPRSTKPASPGVASALERLVRETQRSLQALVSDPLDPVAPSELVLVGGSARAEGLAPYLEQQLGLPCQRLKAESEPRLAEAGPEVFAQAAALALRAAPTERVTRMDFRQAGLSYTADLAGLRRQLQLAVVLFAAALVLWVASAGARVWLEGSRASALEDTLASIYQQAFPAGRTGGDAMLAMERELRNTRELSSHLGVTGRGLSTLDVLREISARVPDDLEVTLQDLRIERNGVVAQGHSADFVSADRLRSQLAEFEGFRSVVVSNVTNDARRGGKNFELRIRLEDEP